MNRLLLAVFVTVGVWACGDDDRPEALPPGEAGRGSVPLGGSSGNAGTIGGGGAGEDAGAGGEGPRSEGGSAGDPGTIPEPSAPRVTITAPEPVTDPAGAGVLTDRSLDVVCLALPADAPGASPVDPSSVTIELLDASSAPVTEATGVSTGKAGEYSATLVIPDIDSGRVTVRCSANDSGPQPLVGTDLVESFFDAGPLITIREPARDSPQSLRGAIPVEFLVDPSPLADPDPKSAIEAVTLIVQGQEIPTTVMGNIYRASLELSDLSKFPVTPTAAVPVGIRARNRRQVERREDYNFRVDAVGPAIVIESPDDRNIVGQQVPIVFTVTDDQIGVNPDSVVLTINQEEHRYDGSASWTVAGNRYTFRYDWGQIDPSLSQVTVNIRASDFASNAARGASLVLYVDNVAPYISLDPPLIREVVPVGPRYACSPPFDPLFGAVGDRDGLAQPISGHVLLRAYVQDRTNVAPGQTNTFYSKVNRTSVRLYLREDPENTPLLTDLRGEDDQCDDIFDMAGTPFVELDALPSAGSIWGGSLVPEQMPSLGNYAPLCDEAQPNTQRLCGGWSDMARFVYDEIIDDPLVFAVAPSEDLTDTSCSGVSWDIREQANGREGWVCVAAVVEDSIGNREVSAPLRLCLSDGDPDKCPLSEIPDCTDGCDPVIYDAQAPTVPFEPGTRRLR